MQMKTRNQKLKCFRRYLAVAISFISFMIESDESSLNEARHEKVSIRWMKCEDVFALSSSLSWRVRWMKLDRGSNWNAFTNGSFRVRCPITKLPNLAVVEVIRRLLKSPWVWYNCYLPSRSLLVWGKETLFGLIWRLKKSWLSIQLLMNKVIRGVNYRDSILRKPAIYLNCQFDHVWSHSLGIERISCPWFVNIWAFELFIATL